MNKKDKNWGVINNVVTIAGAVLTIISIFTGAKACNYEETMADKRLEEKYGLKEITHEE